MTKKKMGRPIGSKNEKKATPITEKIIKGISVADLMIAISFLQASLDRDMWCDSSENELVDVIENLQRELRKAL